MTANHYVFISHAPEDRATAEYLAGDLERQGVRTCLSPGDDAQADQLLHGAAALVVLAGASASMRGQAERAAQWGKPVHAVRLSEGAGPALAGLPILSWTDAFGPQAPANVARLGQELRVAAMAHAAPPLPHAAPPAYPPAPAPYPGAPGYGQPAPRGRNTGLIIAGSVIGGLVLVAGLLEATEVINIIPSRDSSYSSSTYSGSSYNGSGSGSTASTRSNMSATNSYASAAAVSEDWLSNGSWQPVCGHSTFMTFTTDGVAENQAGRGTYTLAGNVVTLSGEGESIDLTIARIGENTLTMTIPGRAPARLTRCFPTMSYSPGLSK
jgi:hypothetical protein